MILEKLAAPEKSQALAVRGRFYASLGEWNKAAADLTKAMELGSDDVLGVWCPLALVQLTAGRMHKYSSLCEEMLERSESHWIVGTCTLAPNAVADLTRLTRNAEKLVTREPKNADFIAVLGFALYRNGDLDGAAQKLELSLRLGSELHQGQASKLVLAMAYHRLGRGAEAQSQFQEVTKWMDTKEDVSANTPLAWAFRVGLQVLHSEAQEVLKQEFKQQTAAVK